MKTRTTNPQPSRQQLNVSIPMDTVDWLLDGDAAIRWQTMRDLLDAAPETDAERDLVATSGWAKQLLDRQDPDGTRAVQHKHSGKVWFDMEKGGGPSRWNTLRALRVLRWHRRVAHPNS